MSEALPKKDYELAIDNFLTHDVEYQRFKGWFESGAYIYEAASQNPDPTYLQEQHTAVLQGLKDRIEARNVALNEVANKMRPAVAIDPTQWRGVRGKSSSVTYMGFKVQSVTKRSFTVNELFQEIEKLGLTDRMMKLIAFDKDNVEYKLVNQMWEVDFPNLLKWLEENQLDTVINSAYNEEESTPSVTGPKPVIFLTEGKK